MALSASKIRTTVSFAALAVAAGALSACGGGRGQTGEAPPILPLSGRVTAAALPPPFEERSMQALRVRLPLGAAQLVRLPHINPSLKATLPSNRGPRNVADQDGGGQSGYIIAPGTASGDGSIYVAMTAYSDAWVTTPTDGTYNTVNAPTTHGPNGNCIETLTNYYNGFGTPGTTVDQIQFYDFCANNGQGAFVGALPMDAAFVRDYVRMYADSSRPMPRYVSAVIHSATDNRWHAYLYNASLMTYVDFYDSAAGENATANGSEGWSIFETHYNGGDCSALPDASEEAIQIRTSAGWQLLGAGTVSSYAWGTCFSGPFAPPYYVPDFSTNPSVAWTVTSRVLPALAEYARAINADAPLAYYRLGDSSSTALDSSATGSGLPGNYGANVTRGVSSLLAVESTNSAAQFPGGASVAANVVGIAPAQRLQPARSVSVETWIKLSQPSVGTTDIVAYGPETAGQAYTLQLLGNDTVAAYITTPGGSAFVSGKTVLAVNNTYLVDATYDGSNLSVYVDGVLDGSAPASGPLNYSKVSGTNGLALGSSFSSGRQAFCGTLDEVAVFGAGLTAAQIAAHWTAGSGVAVAPAVSSYAAAIDADAPLAFYRLSDANGTAADATANHLNATYGSAVKRDVAGLVVTDPTNSGAAFPGGSSQTAVAVTAGRNLKFESPQNVSIETWLETPAIPSGTVDLISYGPEGLGQPYTLQLLANGTVAMFVTTLHGYGFVQGHTPLSLNASHLIDATYDGSSMNVYVDGNLDASHATSGLVNYSKESPPFGLSIGTAFDTHRSAFAGELDDVAIYGTALTASRVATHWAAGSGRVVGPLSASR